MRRMIEEDFSCAILSALDATRSVASTKSKDLGVERTGPHWQGSRVRSVAVVIKGTGKCPESLLNRFAP
jgi:hypothetical protein